MLISANIHINKKNKSCLTLLFGVIVNEVLMFLIVNVNIFWGSWWYYWHSELWRTQHGCSLICSSYTWSSEVCLFSSPPMSSVKLGWTVMISCGWLSSICIRCWSEASFRCCHVRILTKDHLKVVQRGGKQDTWSAFPTGLDVSWLAVSDSPANLNTSIFGSWGHSTNESSWSGIWLTDSNIFSAPDANCWSPLTDTEVHWMLN